jgi:hypothetical protein
MKKENKIIEIKRKLDAEKENEIVIYKKDNEKNKKLLNLRKKFYKAKQEVINLVEEDYSDGPKIESTLKIESNVKTVGFSIKGKVVYDEDRQKVMILTFLGRFCLLAKQMCKKFPKQKEKVEEHMLEYLALGILILSLFMKEKHWNEEKEWRIIYIFPSQNFLDFRKTDKGLIPFLHIPIFKEHALKCINGVRLPKSPDYALRKKAIQMLWDKVCNENKIKKDLKVEESSISIVY